MRQAASALPFTEKFAGPQTYVILNQFCKRSRTLTLDLKQIERLEYKGFTSTKDSPIIKYMKILYVICTLSTAIAAFAAETGFFEKFDKRFPKDLHGKYFDRGSSPRYEAVARPGCTKSRTLPALPKRLSDDEALSVIGRYQNDGDFIKWLVSIRLEEKKARIFKDFIDMLNFGQRHKVDQMNAYSKANGYLSADALAQSAEEIVTEIDSSLKSKIVSEKEKEQMLGRFTADKLKSANLNPSTTVLVAKTENSNIFEVYSCTDKAIKSYDENQKKSVDALTQRMQDFRKRFQLIKFEEIIQKGCQRVGEDKFEFKGPASAQDFIARLDQIEQGFTSIGATSFAIEPKKSPLDAVSNYLPLRCK